MGNELESSSSGEKALGALEDNELNVSQQGTLNKKDNKQHMGLYEQEHSQKVKGSNYPSLLSYYETTSR